MPDHMVPFRVFFLAVGRLVLPFALAVRKQKGWFLTFRDAAQSNPAFVAFMDWMRDEAQVEMESGHLV